MVASCRALRRTYRAGDLAKAREQMGIIFNAKAILESGKYVQKVKYGCELQGTPVGLARMPLGPLSEEEKAEFRKAMEPVLNWT